MTSRAALQGAFTAQHLVIAVLSALVVLFVGRAAGAAAALGLALAGLAAVPLIRLPAAWWPSLLLLVTIAAPASALPLPGFRGQNGSINLALLLSPLWLLVVVTTQRGRRWSRSRQLVALAAVPAVVALCASAVVSGVTLGSAAWTLNFIVLVIGVSLLLDGESLRPLLRVVVWSGALLGAYAVLEAQVLRSNPLWGWASAADARASASFGGPLFAASFFALALVVAVVFLARQPTAGAALLATGCAAGLAAAGSRGALIAAVAGLVGLVVAVVLGRAGPRRQLAPLAVISVLFALVAVGGLTQRAIVGGADGSNTVRQRSLDTGLYLASNTEPLGRGPGQAYVVKTSTPGPGTDEERSIENAWIELYVAVGPVGCAAIALFVGSCLAVGVRHGRWVGVAGAGTLLVGFTFYNALEASAKPMTMLMLGIALGACLVGGAQARDPLLAAGRAPSAGLALVQTGRGRRA